jgi:hypothetical protein
MKIKGGEDEEKEGAGEGGRRRKWNHVISSDVSTIWTANAM